MDQSVENAINLLVSGEATHSMEEYSSSFVYIMDKNGDEITNEYTEDLISGLVETIRDLQTQIKILQQSLAAKDGIYYEIDENN